MAGQDNGQFVVPHQRHGQCFHPLQQLSIILLSLLPAPEVNKLAAIALKRPAPSVSPVMMKQPHDFSDHLLVLSLVHQQATFQTVEKEENVTEFACRWVFIPAVCRQPFQVSGALVG